MHNDTHTEIYTGYIVISFYSHRFLTRIIANIIKISVKIIKISVILFTCCDKLYFLMCLSTHIQDRVTIQRKILERSLLMSTFQYSIPEFRTCEVSNWGSVKMRKVYLKYEKLNFEYCCYITYSHVFSKKNIDFISSKK